MSADSQTPDQLAELRQSLTDFDRSDATVEEWAIRLSNLMLKAKLLQRLPALLDAAERLPKVQADLDRIDERRQQLELLQQPLLDRINALKVQRNNTAAERDRLRAEVAACREGLRQLHDACRSSDMVNMEWADKVLAAALLTEAPKS